MTNDPSTPPPAAASDAYPVAFAVECPERELNRLSTFFRPDAAVRSAPDQRRC